MTPPSLPSGSSRRAQQEQRDAAALLGVLDVRFLGYTDGELTYSRALLGDIVREIREFQPFAVYTHDPEPVIIRNSFVNHADHRITGLATVDAVYPPRATASTSPSTSRTALQPHKVRELYLWGANEPNFDVDITDVVELKIQALLAHRSQFRRTRASSSRCARSGARRTGARWSSSGAW
jgi:LmbE family N-acetylglucosaminyl deacetylase